MIKVNPPTTDPNLAREIAEMRLQARQHSVRNGISWCALFVAPAILAGTVFIMTASEVLAIGAAIITNVLSRSILQKLGWSEP